MHPKINPDNKPITDEPNRIRLLIDQPCSQICFCVRLLKFNNLLFPPKNISPTL